MPPPPTNRIQIKARGSKDAALYRRRPIRRELRNPCEMKQSTARRAPWRNAVLKRYAKLEVSFGMPLVGKNLPPDSTTNIRPIMEWIEVALKVVSLDVADIIRCCQCSNRRDTEWIQLQVPSVDIWTVHSVWVMRLHLTEFHTTSEDMITAGLRRMVTSDHNRISCTVLQEVRHGQVNRRTNCGACANG